MSPVFVDCWFFFMLMVKNTISLMVNLTTSVKHFFYINKNLGLNNYY